MKCQYCGAELVFEYQLLPSLGTIKSNLSKHITYIFSPVSESDECGRCVIVCDEGSGKVE